MNTSSAEYYTGKNKQFDHPHYPPAPTRGRKVPRAPAAEVSGIRSSAQHASFRGIDVDSEGQVGDSINDIMLCAGVEKPASVLLTSMCMSGWIS